MVFEVGAAKKKILFIGSFKQRTKDDSVGGQMFACNTLINSALRDRFEWTLLDSTSDSNIIGSFARRLYKAALRTLKFSGYILTNRFDTILIFTANGWSFIEKGLLALLARVVSRSRIILAPRSGLIVEDVNRRSFLSYFIPFVMRKCHVVICQSETWKKYFQDLCAGSDSNRFVVIENWIDTREYFALQQRNDDRSGIQIIFLSWVVKNKGIFELMEAAKKLALEKLNFNLIVAGGGADLEDAKRISAEHGLSHCVKFVGWALGNKKLELLESSDIYVLPTYFEGYPNSLLEAMAAGKACIASRVGGIPDIIEHGCSGLLIEPRNATDLYNKLKLLICESQLRNQLATAARQIIVERNTEVRAIEKFKTILD